MTNAPANVVDFGIATIAKEVQRLPKDWVLIPINGKKIPPYGKWEDSRFKAEDFEKAVVSNVCEGARCKVGGPNEFTLPSKWVKAAGVLCGIPSGGLLFLDHDGSTADTKILELSGCSSVKEALPKTALVTSGRPHRYQAIYRISRRRDTSPRRASRIPLDWLSISSRRHSSRDKRVLLAPSSRGHPYRRCSHVDDGGDVN